MKGIMCSCLTTAAAYRYKEWSNSVSSLARALRQLLEYWRHQISIFNPQTKNVITYFFLGEKYKPGSVSYKWDILHNYQHSLQTMLVKYKCHTSTYLNYDWLFGAFYWIWYLLHVLSCMPSAQD